MATKFQIYIDVTMPGDDPEDELEELEEKIGALMLRNPSWTARVDIVGQED